MFGSKWMGNGGLSFTLDIPVRPLAQLDQKANNLILCNPGVLLALERAICLAS